ncbi:MAG TPA: FAD-dependent oxidoreductase [Chloroflexota bacterium]|nr:FAD-dependent oxidoreductase [Chloroflexota bacterium]
MNPATSSSRFNRLSFKDGDSAEVLSIQREADSAGSQRPNRVYAEPARQTPVFAETEVLVVGGGPAGCAAAVAAARAGAQVLLVERYGHLGGLSTGGLVFWIDRMTDWAGKQVIAGFAVDILDRLPSDSVVGPPREDWGSRDPAKNAYWGQRSASFRDTVTWAPKVDPEWLKIVSLDMLREAGVRLLLHAWAVAPILEGTALRGAIFESKEGRHAILAKVVVDASGDGDIYAGAGAAYSAEVDTASMHHCVNTAWTWGGVDMERWLRFRREEREAVARIRDQGRAEIGEVEFPYSSWRPDVALFLGPRLTGYSPVKVEDLTAIEIESRQWMVKLLAFFREHCPGFEQAWIMQTAQETGIRHSRRLGSLQPICKADWELGRRYPDEVGVSPSLTPAFASVSVPYRSLIPAEIDGLLAPGRHIGCDTSSHTFMREIPQCWLTGQAAGVGAAVAVRGDTEPRNVDVRRVQAELRRQGVYLQVPAETGSVAEVAGPR